MAVELISALFVVIRLTERELRVRSLFWRSCTVDLSEVDSVTPGYWGLIVRLRDGRKVAVQLSGRRNWAGQVARGPVIAQEILGRAERVRSAVGGATR